ncbi:anoctamin-5 [Eurytemora carolleeae]|uniref:anoctamin-5 n=1 Tax=Eurytemora carolleeae TaxID=1294199 RepID=UPI000C75BF2C|nr:anoctamin-5 [Eurytemora carolleeae]|eukprot:XP_023335666.1 anoctamin-5-like [Eurytemora affinis]
MRLPIRKSEEEEDDEPDQGFLQSWIQRTKKRFIPDPRIRNISKGKELTAIDRARIVNYVLENTRYGEEKSEVGLNRLVEMNVFTDSYSPHDWDKRHLLHLYWADTRNIFKLQPLDAIRDYFGEGISFYFAWQQFYTLMLIFPSLIGLLCFVYGVWTMFSDPISNDICPGGIMADTVMCPRCDGCKPWILQEACNMSKAKHVFDNEAMVLYAAFLIVWYTLYQKLWKRFSAELFYRWNMDEHNPEEESPNTLRIVASWTCVIFLILLIISAVLITIFLRMYIVSQFANYGNWILPISVGGALISAIILIILDFCNGYLAVLLTKLELRRTQSSYEKSLAWKIYIIQLVNNCFPLVYIGFIKGQFIGRPGDYLTVLGYRLEECSPGGCFIELSVQVGFVFFFKQIILSGKEFYLPQLLRWYKNPHSRADHLYDIQMIKDHELEEFDQQGLSKEYLEIDIEMSYVMFSAACPLALLVALGKNLVETRFDAKKLLLQHRRPVAQKMRNIGIWRDSMNFLGWFVIVINALMITVTSDLITKWVYSFKYTEEGNFKNYTNFTLSSYDQRDNTTCRYQAFDHLPAETNNIIIFTKLLLGIGYIVLFGICKLIISCCIPDESKDLTNRKEREESRSISSDENQIEPVVPTSNIDEKEETKQTDKVNMATNRIDILDSALPIPGRIDRIIEFPLANEEARLDILKNYSRKMNLTGGINLRKIAEQMGGSSGAEVKGTCTEAGMYALRERRVHVTQEDFEMAVAKIMQKDS